MVVVFASVLSLPRKVCMCEAADMPGKTIGSSGREWLTVQEALNLGTRTLPAGTGAGFMAVKSASCFCHLAWSMVTQPSPDGVPPVGAGVEGAGEEGAGVTEDPPSVNQLTFT